MDGMVTTVLETTEDLALATLDAEEMDGPSEATDLVDAVNQVNSEKIKVASVTVTLSEDVVDLKENRADVCSAGMEASSMDLAAAVVLEDRSLEVTDVVAIAIGMEQAPPLIQVLRYLRPLQAPVSND
ncbi:hypothetical protein QR680_013805 [Steinernema hermaphroditum]|uniref:Uncharacterized protein n=1 Tax=Steinernema hermaphroditum TaxID=289476 RepID=A0AA39I854_9BILA|nr:hypothetical protein QR680_013805 [Steinernema hermaphroditum]